MNWKEQRELRKNQMQNLEVERKKLARLGWDSLGKAEREQLRKVINFSWDKVPEYAKNKTTKDEFVKFETKEYCIKIGKNLKDNSVNILKKKGG